MLKPSTALATPFTVVMDLVRIARAIAFMGMMATARLVLETAHMVTTGIVPLVQVTLLMEMTARLAHISATSFIVTKLKIT